MWKILTSINKWASITVCFFPTTDIIWLLKKVFEMP